MPTLVMPDATGNQVEVDPQKEQVDADQRIALAAIQRLSSLGVKALPAISAIEEAAGRVLRPPIK